MGTADKEEFSVEARSGRSKMTAPTPNVQNCPIRSNYPISKVLLDGLYDPDCLLSLLRGCQHVMRRIWEELLIYWTRAVRLPQKDLEKGDYMGLAKKANENRPQPFYLTPIDMDPDVGGYGFPAREKTKDRCWRQVQRGWGRAGGSGTRIAQP